MHRRMKAWPALGLIMKLSLLSKETIEAAASKWTWSNDDVIPDESLAKYLRVTKPKNLEFFMSFSSVVPPPSLANLRHFAESRKGVYCKNSILDFHRFCVCLVIGFARALEDVRVASMQHSGQTHSNLDKVEAAATRVTYFIKPMLCLAHSQALFTHLDMLALGNALHMPIVASKEEYETFLKECLTDGSSTPPSTDAKTVSGPTTTSMESDSVSGLGEGLEPVTEPSEDSEIIAMSSPVSSIANGVLFRKWIMGFVGHFSAQSKLERNVTRLGQTSQFQIRFIAAVRPQVDLGSWDDMRELVNGVLQYIKGSRSGNKKTAGQYMFRLSQHIRQYNASSSQEKKSYHGVYQQFSKLLYFRDAGVTEPENLFSGTLHCEAILAILVKYYEILIPKTRENKALLDICQVSIVSTSPSFA